MEENMTRSIVEIKRKISWEEWQRRIQECQNNGLPVRKCDQPRQLLCSSEKNP